jgi:hypothetical protein
MLFDKVDLDNYITGHHGEDQFTDQDGTEIDAFGPEELPGEIGIPNVPAIVRHERQKLQGARIAAGLCWRCGTPLRGTDTTEYCPQCERDE